MDIILQVCGWLGALGLLAAFYLNSTNKLTASSSIYLWINFVCAVLLTINAFYIKAYPFLIINSFWAGVALVSILSLGKKQP